MVLMYVKFMGFYSNKWWILVPQVLLKVQTLGPREGPCNSPVLAKIKTITRTVDHSGKG